MPRRNTLGHHKIKQKPASLLTERDFKIKTRNCDGYQRRQLKPGAVPTTMVTPYSTLALNVTEQYLYKYRKKCVYVIIQIEI